MSKPLWVPGARRLSTPAKHEFGSSSDFPDAGPHMIWHSTESGSGQGIDGPVNTLVAKEAEVTWVYDPVTDELGQFLPATLTGKGLENDYRNGRRTNRAGWPCLQIEVCAYAGRPFTDYAKFGPNFRSLGRFLDAWGVPHVWPSGPPPGQKGPFPRPDRYYTTPGHYSHSEVPGQAGGHWDPGAIDIDRLFEALYEEDDMPSVSEVWNTDHIVKSEAFAKDHPNNPDTSAATALANIIDRLDRLENKVDSLTPSED